MGTDVASCNCKVFICVILQGIWFNFKWESFIFSLFWPSYHLVNCNFLDIFFHLPQKGQSLSFTISKVALMEWPLAQRMEQPLTPYRDHCCNVKFTPLILPFQISIYIFSIHTIWMVNSRIDILSDTWIFPKFPDSIWLLQYWSILNTAKQNSKEKKTHAIYRCAFLSQTGFNSAVTFTDGHQEKNHCNL